MFYHHPESQWDILVPIGTGPVSHFMLRIRYRTLASSTSPPVIYFQTAGSCPRHVNVVTLKIINI
jgi:hypothetical protein